MYLSKETEFVKVDNGYIIVNLINAAADFIEDWLYNALSGNKFDEIDNEIIAKLESRKYLFESEVEYKSFIESVETKITECEETSVPTFVVVPTYLCNLKCIYCFEDSYTIHDRSNKSTIEQIDKQFEVIDTILKENKAENSPINITIMGGEPLIKNNVENIQRIFELAEKKNFTVDIVTNGVNIDYYLPLFMSKKNVISHIQVTLDGTREYHDKRRIFKDKSGTFDIIIKNVKFLIDNDILVYLRVNVDTSNINNLPSLADLLIKNFYPTEMLKPYLYLLQDGGCSGEGNIIKEEIGINKLLIMEKENENMKIFDKKYHGHLFIDAIEKNVQFQSMLKHCGAAKKQFIIDCKGNIYKCWHGIGNDNFSVGNFRSGSIEYNKNEIDLWYNRSALKLERCRDCKYRFICGTGCPAAKHLANDQLEIDKPSCVDYSSIINMVVKFKFSNM